MAYYSYSAKRAQPAQAIFTPEDHARIKAEGHAAGLSSGSAIILCPYDGRTKAGRSWWDGFMTGDAERCGAAREEAP